MLAPGMRRTAQRRPDLMAALEASLAAVRADSGPAPAKPAAKKTDKAPAKAKANGGAKAPARPRKPAQTKG